eukprot:gene48321-biopygen39249
MGRANGHHVSLRQEPRPELIVRIELRSFTRAQHVHRSVIPEPEHPDAQLSQSLVREVAGLIPGERATNCRQGDECPAKSIESASPPRFNAGIDPSRKHFATMAITKHTDLTGVHQDHVVDRPSGLCELRGHRERDQGAGAEAPQHDRALWVRRQDPAHICLGDLLDGIEESMMSERDEQQRQKLTRLRRSIINLRRVLWPQRDVLNTLEIEDLSFLSARDRARLKEASARSARLGDELQVLAERAALIHEQVLDTRAEQMNRTMLVLTAATVIAMPMTVVSGLLGMN